MKIAKQQLLNLIKEELDAVMKEAESDLEEMLDDRRAKSKPAPFKKGPVGAPDKENDPAAVAYRAYRDGAERDEFKKGVEDDAKKKGDRLGESEDLEEAKKIRDTYGREVTKAIKDDLKAQDKKNALASMKKQTLKGKIEETEELEEMKGPMGANLAKFGREMARPTGGDPSDSVRSAIHNVALSADEPVAPEDRDGFEAGTKDEEIDGMLSVMGVDPQSQEGMALRVAIKAAAEKVRARSAKRYGQAAQGGLNEEEKEMEQISESFRRFTKVLKG